MSNYLKIGGIAAAVLVGLFLSLKMFESTDVPSNSASTTSMSDRTNDRDEIKVEPQKSVRMPTSNTSPALTEATLQAVSPQPVAIARMSVLALIAAAMTDNKAAILSAKVALDSFPKPEEGDRDLGREKNKLGLNALKENAYETAIARLNEGVAADPSDVELKSNLGYALMMAGKLDDAKKTLIDSVALDSAHGATWANLGQTLAKQGNVDSAVAAFVNSFIFSRAQNKTVEYLTNLSQSDMDVMVRLAAAKALEAPLIIGVAVINK